MLQSKRGGFTFVEVLVVVGIIAVVAAIGYAISGPAREKARQSVCANQLRQLHAAVMMYTADVDAGEEVPGLGPLATEASMGYKVLKPYLTTRDVLYCPDLPSLLTKKVGASYIWMPVSRSMIPNPTAGEVGLFVRQEREIAALGTRFPLYVCHVHDEAFYQPAEAGIDSRLSQPFILEVSVAGSLGIGRRHYRRINILDGWAMLPSR